jgi:hypothetical protein
MRSDRKVKTNFGNYDEFFLTEAVNWFQKNDIPLYGIQKDPDQISWTDSPKAYANIYIDDAALGCPLIYPENNNERPYADWIAIRKLLIEKGANDWNWGLRGACEGGHMEIVKFLCHNLVNMHKVFML